MPRAGFRAGGVFLAVVVLGGCNNASPGNSNGMGGASAGSGGSGSVGGNTGAGGASATGGAAGEATAGHGGATAGAGGATAGTGGATAAPAERQPARVERRPARAAPAAAGSRPGWSDGRHGRHIRRRRQRWCDGRHGWNHARDRERDLMRLRTDPATAAGTIDNPTTLASAVTKVSAGGTIYLRGGKYGLTSTVSLSKSGSSSSPINLRSYLLDADRPVSTSRTRPPAVAG